MDIPEPYIKAVLCYLITLNRKLSIYQFEIRIGNSFRFKTLPYLPGEFYRVLMDRNLITKCMPEGNQMDAFTVSELGKQYVGKELAESQSFLSRLSETLSTLSLTDVNIQVPFLKFSVNRQFVRLLILFWDGQYKLLISVAKDISSEHIEYAEIIVDNKTSNIVENKILALLSH